MLLGAADVPDAWERVIAAEPEPVATISVAGLEIARAFAEFADLKVGFLRGHSTRVAELAANAAEAGLLALGVLRGSRRGPLPRSRAGIGAERDLGEARSSERGRVGGGSPPSLLHRAGAGALPGVGTARSPRGSHHERLDGSGYHRGATAAQLGVGARLLAAADAFDAMTHDRPAPAGPRPGAGEDELGVMVGAGTIDKRAADAVLEAAGSAPTETRQGYPAGLTEREEVLRLLAQGKTNREIGEALVITEKTAGHHVEHIYAKADVSTRVGRPSSPCGTTWSSRHNTGESRRRVPKDGAFTRCRGDRGRLASRSNDRGREEGSEHAGDRGERGQALLRDPWQREPLVLVHGSWVDATRWRFVVPGLAESFRVLVYDRRGHSRSERPDAPGSVDEDGDLAALLETLDLAPAHVVTSSYGGNIALRLATRRPQIFRSLSATSHRSGACSRVIRRRRRSSSTAPAASMRSAGGSPTAITRARRGNSWRRSPSVLVRGRTSYRRR